MEFSSKYGFGWMKEKYSGNESHEDTDTDRPKHNHKHGRGSKKSKREYVSDSDASVSTLLSSAKTCSSATASSLSSSASEPSYGSSSGSESGSSSPSCGTAVSNSITFYNAESSINSQESAYKACDSICGSGGDLVVAGSVSPSSACDAIQVIESAVHGHMLTHDGPCKRVLRYRWTVPGGVKFIYVTMSGGGGAGGCSQIAGSTVTNGRGGQSGTVFQDAPVRVKEGDVIDFYVGNGGIPDCNGLEQDTPLPGDPAYPESILNQDFGPEYKCYRQNQILRQASGGRAVVDGTTGAPSVVSIVYGNSRKDLLTAAGGFSGDQSSDPNFVGLRTFNGTGGIQGQYGLLGDITSSVYQFPQLSAGVPGQGGSNPFGPGGVPLVAPISQIVDFRGQYSGVVSSRGTPSPNGEFGSGGAGATVSYPAGSGGSGFIRFTY